MTMKRIGLGSTSQPSCSRLSDVPHAEGDLIVVVFPSGVRRSAVVRSAEKGGCVVSYPPHMEHKYFKGWNTRVENKAMDSKTD